MLTYNSYGTEYKIKLQLTTYQDNGNLALCATCYDEEYKFWEPFGTFTVNLGEKLPDDCAYVRQSGFCMYPLYKFDIAKIRSIIATQDNEDE